MNVFATDGSWVEHPNSDVFEHSTDEMLSRLASFYDGTAEWAVDATNEKVTFWEMLVRSLPENFDTD